MQSRTITLVMKPSAPKLQTFLHIGKKQLNVFRYIGGDGIHYLHLFGIKISQHVIGNHGLIFGASNAYAYPPIFGSHNGIDAFQAVVSAIATIYFGQL